MLARSYLTPEHRRAGEQIRTWMREGIAALRAAIGSVDQLGADHQVVADIANEQPRFAIEGEGGQDCENRVDQHGVEETTVHLG